MRGWARSASLQFFSFSRHAWDGWRWWAMSRCRTCLRCASSRKRVACSIWLRRLVSYSAALPRGSLRSIGCWRFEPPSSSASSLPLRSPFFTSRVFLRLDSKTTARSALAAKACGQSVARLSATHADCPKGKERFWFSSHKDAPLNTSSKSFRFRSAPLKLTFGTSTGKLASIPDKSSSTKSSQRSCTERISHSRQ